MVIFSKNNQVVEIIENIYRKGWPIPPEKPNKNISIEKLEEWKKRNIRQLNEFLKQAYGDEIDRLLALLKPLLK